VSIDPAEAAAAAAREAYLERLRRRVARPAEVAARIRQGLPPEPETAPVLLRPAPRPAVAAAPPVPVSPTGAPEAQAAGRWSLWSLEQLARRASADDPVRAQELTYTLVYLRHHADIDGRLPAKFTGLVEQVFPLPAAQQ
jgi:hypothetical protein